MRPNIASRETLAGLPKFTFHAGGAAPSAAAQQQNAFTQNMGARQAVLGQALNMWQPISAQSLATPTAGSVYNIPVRQVGFTKRFLVKSTLSFTTGATGVYSLSPMGTWNFWSQAVVNDLSNYTRINTTGWHLSMLASRKKAFFSGLASSGMAAYQPNPGLFGQTVASDFPGGTNTTPSNTAVNFLNAWGCMAAPSVTANVTAYTATVFHELPLAYSDVDLRGAIYTSVVSATMNIQLTLNANLFVANNADPTLAVYGAAGASTVVLNTLNLTVYQNYLDQLPFSNQGPILPALDLSKMYLLTNTSFTGLASGQDFPIPFPNFRAWQSLAFVLDDGVTPWTAAGTDVTRLQLQTANLTNVWQFQDAGAPTAAIPLNTQALFNRFTMGTDWPKGCYFMDFRDRPINTNNFGNMQFTVSPNVSTAILFVGFEGIGIANQVITAGSIPGN